MIYCENLFWVGKLQLTLPVVPFALHISEGNLGLAATLGHFHPRSLCCQCLGKVLVIRCFTTSTVMRSSTLLHSLKDPGCLGARGG